MALVEDTKMGDWLRTGKQGVAELLISYGLRDVCVLARKLRDEGNDESPIFQEVVEMCGQKRARRQNQRPRPR